MFNRNDLVEVSYGCLTYVYTNNIKRVLSEKILT